MIVKIRRKFILITLCVLVFVIGGIVLGINIVNYSIFNNEKDRVLELLLENNGSMPNSIEDFEPNGENPSIFTPDLPKETRFRNRYFTVIVFDDGMILSNTKDVFSVDEPEALEYYEKVGNKTEGFVENYKFNSKTIDNGTIYVFLDCEQELTTAKSLLIISCIIGLFAILIITLLTVLFSKIVTHPIAESYKNQKRFITDANHELKTPVTIIGATNEILEIQYGKNEWTEAINNQVNRLSHLTEELVTLSRMDEETVKAKIENIDLGNIVSQMVEPYQMISDKNGYKISVDIDENVCVNADKDMMTKLVSIMLDNANKYAGKDGSISVSLKEDGKKKILSFYNTCEEVPVGDLDYLFDRFYRLDKSRNSETGGFGIGLSIAKMIADINKAQIKAYSIDGRSVNFEIIFNR